MGLCISKGAIMMDRKQLEALPVPKRTGSYVPIPHSMLADLTRKCFAQANLDIAAEYHAVTDGGERYFGLMEVGRAVDGKHVAICGVRNSHDKAITAGLAIGSRVLVCDNLAFSGDIQFSRRHVGQIESVLPVLVGEAVLSWIKTLTSQNNRYKIYEKLKADTNFVHEALVRSVYVEAIPPTALKDVVNEIKTPRYTDFRDGSVWSAFNCFTTVMKDRNLPVDDLRKRSIRLTEIFDSMAQARMN